MNRTLPDFEEVKAAMLEKMREQIKHMMVETPTRPLMMMAQASPQAGPHANQQANQQANVPSSQNSAVAAHLMSGDPNAIVKVTRVYEFEGTAYSVLMQLQRSLLKFPLQRYPGPGYEIFLAEEYVGKRPMEVARPAPMDAYSTPIAMMKLVEDMFKRGVAGGDWRGYSDSENAVKEFVDRLISQIMGGGIDTAK